MIRVGLIGLGAMGAGHRKTYEKLMSEGFEVKLVSVCDIVESKMDDKLQNDDLNVAIKSSGIVYKTAKYTDYKEMIAKEDLDYVDIATPTFMHKEMAVYAMEEGLHVFCEKPMALNAQDAQAMVDASKKLGKKLLIGQCLRFWPSYEYLKEYVRNNKFGKIRSGYFYRGGGFPSKGWKNWFAFEDKSGCCIVDQHVHDVDTINWLFGMPKAVTSIGATSEYSDGFDAVSTNYIYDNMVINAQDDWSIKSKDYGFNMVYRVNFEEGLIELCKNGDTVVYPAKGDKFIADLSDESGYNRELKYFVNAIKNDTEILTATPESTKETIRMAEAELKSAHSNGMIIEL